MNTLLSSQIEIDTKPFSEKNLPSLREPEPVRQRRDIELTDFQFAAVVRDVCKWAVRTETGSVVSAPCGSGKTWAADEAQAALSMKVDSVLLLRCKYLNNPKELRVHIADQLDICGRDNLGPQRLLELAQKRLSKKHVSLVICDDAHALSPEGQEYLWNLVRNVRDKYGRIRKIGIVALVTDDRAFVQTAAKFGRFLRRVALPPMSPDEVANYLTWQCPALKGPMDDLDQQEAATLLNMDLCVTTRHTRRLARS